MESRSHLYCSLQIPFHQTTLAKKITEQNLASIKTCHVALVFCISEQVNTWHCWDCNSGVVLFILVTSVCFSLFYVLFYTGSYHQNNWNLPWINLKIWLTVVMLCFFFFFLLERNIDCEMTSKQAKFAYDSVWIYMLWNNRTTWSTKGWFIYP